MTEAVAQEQKQEQDQQQTTLLDLNGKKVFANFYDDKSPVFIPNNPLHFKIHKLQTMVDNLERQSLKNPAQFNSRNYLDAVDALMKCYEQIRELAGEQLDERNVAAGGNNPAATTVGERAASSMGAGISADNPLAR